MLAPITKSSTMLSADDAARVIACALRTASTYPAGPVHIECPGDAASAKGVPSPFSPTDAPAPPALSIAGSLIAQLAGTRKPLLLVGLEARRPEHALAIRGLCDRRGVPAMVTYKAKGVVPDSHPWFAGVFTNAAIEREIIDESDLLIGVGLDPVELLPRRWTFQQPIVSCGPAVADNRHIPFADRIVADVAVGVGALEAALSVSDWDPACLQQQVGKQRRQVAIPTAGLAAHRVVEIAASRLASHVGRVTVDAGAHMLPATMRWPVHEPDHLLISDGLSTMGFALPAAIGAALVDGGRPVVALTGDGGSLMCLGELLTAAREKLRVIVIVFSDASLSLIEIKQQARQLSPAGVALGAIDWPALAASVGVAAWKASDEAELDRAVHEALACDGPSLIEAKIDRSNYGATLRAVRGS
jgi:acetolactate synthase-1/2/3 large subunit